MKMFVTIKRVPLPFSKVLIPIPLIAWKKSQNANLVLVKKITPDFKCKYEHKLFQELSKHNYYVSPSVPSGKFEITFALIPFQVAIVNSDGISQRDVEKMLTRRGWTVVFYNTEELQRDFYEVLRKIHSATASKKSV